MSGPVPANEVLEILTRYVFDPRGDAIVATNSEQLSWLAGPLFMWIGPGNAVPIVDEIAALILGPSLRDRGQLVPIVTERRFAPHADDTVALAIAALDRGAQETVLETLFADPGPDPALLALSTVQCGRTLAWSPQLIDAPIADPIVAALLALLTSRSPKPLLEAVSRVLGPIAKTRTAHGQRVRATALLGLDALDESAELAASCAHVLGFAAPEDRNAFIAYRSVVLDRPQAEDIFVAFLSGLIAGAHVPAVTELVEAMLAGEDHEAETALGIADALPLDPIAPQLLAELESANPVRRAAAAGAVQLFGGPQVDAALAARLFDSAPEVVASATRVLVARGRTDLLAMHITRDDAPLRRSIALAGMGDLRVQTITDLVNAVLSDVEETDISDASPIVRLIGDALITSSSGLEVGAQLIADVPQAVGLLAVAAVAGSERDVGVLAPAPLRDQLSRATLPITYSDEFGDSELGALALYLLARMSAGDAQLGEIIAAAIGGKSQYSGQLIAALGELRVANDQTAGALAPLLAPEQPIGVRVGAAAVCGRVLPYDHAAWDDVRALLSERPEARAAAWRALRDRARRR
ncbi:MAG: hypothetical protein JWO36_5284 [Myxococcales bacterium]|nr:hypothetical protein [Myxococcales bacterium]